jgi:hypothetical protein
MQQKKNKFSRRALLGSSAAAMAASYATPLGFTVSGSGGHAASAFSPPPASSGKATYSSFNSLPKVDLNVDAGQVIGPFEWQRHCLSHGGINSHPLPSRVVEGARRLNLPLLRTFMQEFLNMYPRHGKFDWSISDPYMKSLADTGAKVVASLTIKPTPLFPVRDQSIWQPTNLTEWKNVIAAVVKRYSVEQPIVTYWEIGNETDIGEGGGCPMLVNSAEDYFTFYKTHVEAIQSVFPKAKIGGPALANAYADWLPGFLEKCRTTGTQLDFVSWHLYNDDTMRHGNIGRDIRKLVAQFPSRPELLVTEWSKSFDPVSVEEMAFESHRASHAASAILEMMEAGIDYSFYYHVWDQTNYSSEFERFFERPEYMVKHWNELPHRFGLFGVNEEVRPQYFVYQMLSRMGDKRLSAECEESGLRVRAIQHKKELSVLIVNHNEEEAKDLIVNVSLLDLTHSRKMLRTYRIDNHHRWNSETLELLPLETREVDTYPKYGCQVYSPHGTVTRLVLEELG